MSAIDSSDAAALDGLDREVTLDIGGQVDYRFGPGTTVFLRAVTEVTGEHDGSEATLGVRQPLPLGNVPVFLGAGVTWQSGELSQYAYGVLPTDTGFAAYAPGDVTIPYLNIGTSIPLSDNLSLVGNLRAEFLPDAIRDSPIVDEDIAVGAIVGLSFRF
ncbi:MipA/OmpV family protein [Aestuariivita sp.]|uniref:MipA/OmpV family protein n=1 Tax=Aestuariivita sp. TaxID=1872407 RepID=UPI003442C706